MLSPRLAIAPLGLILTAIIAASSPERPLPPASVALPPPAGVSGFGAYASFGPPWIVAATGASEGWLRGQYSPDGTRLVLTFNKGQDVFFALFDGPTRAQLTPWDRANVDPLKQQDENEICWSADGEHFVIGWSDRYGHFAVSMMCVARIFTRDGAPVSGDLLLHPSITGTTAWLPRFAALAGGGWMVVSSALWNEDVVASVFHPDASFSAVDRVIHPPSGSRQNVASLFPTADGGAIAFYSDFVSTTPADILVVRLDADAEPLGLPRVVSAQGAQDLSWCSFSPQGGAAVVWRSGGNGGFVDSRNGPVGDGAWWVPKVAHDSDGRLLYAWEDAGAGVIRVLLDGVPFDLGPLGDAQGQGDRRMPGIAVGRGATAGRVLVTYARTNQADEKLDAIAQEFALSLP